jgi:hypothetical protein
MALVAWLPLPKASSREVLPSTRQEHGICAYLTSKYGGNIAELGKVKITWNSCQPSRENLLPFAVSSDWSNCWISKNKSQNWTLFDFLNVPIYVSRYSVRTYRLGKGFSHLRLWVLQGCMDGKWTDLDTRHDTNGLNGGYRTAAFVLIISYIVTALKIVQTEPNHVGDDFMIFTNVQFFEEVPDDVR